MHTRLVGIINLTPDSFSDGGELADMDAVRTRLDEMITAGAEIADIGAESTRPGAEALAAAEEWRRLQPFMEEVLPEYRNRLQFSIDTRHAETAKRVAELGVDWVNDVGGFAQASMVQAVAPYACRLVVMHSLSIPADPRITIAEGEDPVGVLLAFAHAQLAALEAAGIARERVVFDPGIGFGKTGGQSMEILRRVHELRVLGVPLLIGHSRKSFLKRWGDTRELRDAATLGISARLMGEVDYLRVHAIAAHAALRAACEIEQMP